MELLVWGAWLATGSLVGAVLSGSGVVCGATVGKAGARRTPSGMDEWVKRKRGTDGTMVDGRLLVWTIDDGRFATDCGDGGGVAGCRQASSVALGGCISAPSEFGTGLAVGWRFVSCGTGVGTPVCRPADDRVGYSSARG